MNNFLADKSYIAVKPQVAATTPIVPTTQIPLISTTIKIDPKFSDDRRMKGIDFKSDDQFRGSRQIIGDVVLEADPASLGHILNMCLTKGTTTGSAADGYTHPFLPGDGKSYSLDIPRGDYAMRVWGARGDKLKLAYVDDRLRATLTVKALGAFYSASLALALTGAGMTSAVLSTEQTPRPSDGLVTGDKMLIGAVELTLTSVNADGKTVGFASTSVTASAGDPVYLKAQTAAPSAQLRPLPMSKTLVGVGVDTTAADTAAATKATATPCYQLEAEFMNDLKDAPATGSDGPAALLIGVKDALLTLKTLFTTPVEHQKWIENVKRAVTIIATGDFIKTDLTTSEKLTIKFHRVKAQANEQPLTAGDYIYDEQKFGAFYDLSDAKSIEMSLVNRTADTAY